MITRAKCPHSPVVKSDHMLMLIVPNRIPALHNATCPACGGVVWLMIEDEESPLFYTDAEFRNLYDIDTERGTWTIKPVN